MDHGFRALFRKNKVWSSDSPLSELNSYKYIRLYQNSPVCSHTVDVKLAANLCFRRTDFVSTSFGHCPSTRSRQYPASARYVSGQRRFWLGSMSTLRILEMFRNTVERQVCGQWAAHRTIGGRDIFVVSFLIIHQSVPRSAQTAI